MNLVPTRAIKLLTAIVIFPLLCQSQQLTFTVLKERCRMTESSNAFKIYIEEQSDTGKLVSDFDYWLKPFLSLPDTLKLQIVEKLLSFRNDTDLCCLSVVDRSFNGIEGCSGHPERATRYTTQVDALFMINRLCWPNMMELYSCVPVLYDNVQKVEINDNQQKLKAVFHAYIDWFKHCKKRGRIGKYFPFNNGRYVWYGGRKSIARKDE